MKDLTFSNLHLFSEQEVFDILCRKVLDRASATEGRENLRSPKKAGVRGVLGHLATREVARNLEGIDSLASFSSLTYTMLGWRNVVKGGVTGRSHFALLLGLQQAHDTAVLNSMLDLDAIQPDQVRINFKAKFRRAAARLAIDRKLKFDVLL